jgi:hypothetical protein
MINNSRQLSDDVLTLFFNETNQIYIEYKNQTEKKKQL